MLRIWYLVQNWTDWAKKIAIYFSMWCLQSHMANLVGGLKASFTRPNARRLGHFKWITLYRSLIFLECIFHNSISLSAYFQGVLRIPWKISKGARAQEHPLSCRQWVQTLRHVTSGCFLFWRELYMVWGLWWQIPRSFWAQPLRINLRKFCTFRPTDRTVAVARD